MHLYTHMVSQIEGDAGASEKTKKTCWLSDNVIDAVTPEPHDRWVSVHVRFTPSDVMARNCITIPGEVNKTGARHSPDGGEIVVVCWARA